MIVIVELGPVVRKRLAKCIQHFSCAFHHAPLEVTGEVVVVPRPSKKIQNLNSPSQRPLGDDIITSSSRVDTTYYDTTTTTYEKYFLRVTRQIIIVLHEKLMCVERCSIPSRG